MHCMVAVCNTLQLLEGEAILGLPYYLVDDLNKQHGHIRQDASILSCVSNGTYSPFQYLSIPEFPSRPRIHLRVE